MDAFTLRRFCTSRPDGTRYEQRDTRFGGRRPQAGGFHERICAPTLLRIYAGPARAASDGQSLPRAKPRGGTSDTPGPQGRCAKQSQFRRFWAENAGRGGKAKPILRPPAAGSWSVGA